MTPHVPAVVLAELANPSPPGGRHGQMKDTVLSLLGNGMSPDDVFAYYRPRYDRDLSDYEIWRVIEWGIEQNPGPSGFGDKVARAFPSQHKAPVVKPKVVTAEEAIENARAWLRGFSRSEERLRDRSKWFPRDPDTHATALFLALYSAGELICVNTNAELVGSGETREVGAWIDSFCEIGLPTGDAGVWFRLNPVKTEEGSGKNGAFTDNDVAAFRYLLIESDKLPIDLHLSLYAKLRIPVAAVYLSGGKSVHALIKLDSPDIETYRSRAKLITGRLAFVGFDSNNTNPSRYSRLPGCTRKIGAQGDGIQRLLYLNPDPRRGEAICQ